MPTERTPERWDQIYESTAPEEIPWDEGKPSSQLVQLIESGTVEKGPALDVCCGTANNAIYLAKHGFDCYGTDISPTAIGYAHEKVSLSGVSCELHAGNAARLTYPDDMFVLVFDRGCFHSIMQEDRDAFINGIHRVMKTGARYLMICFSASDPRPHAHSFSEREIRGFFTPLFSILSLTEIPGEGVDREHIFLSALMEK